MSPSWAGSVRQSRGLRRDADGGADDGKSDGEEERTADRNTASSLPRLWILRVSLPPCEAFRDAPGRETIAARNKPLQKSLLVSLSPCESLLFTEWPRTARRERREHRARRDANGVMQDDGRRKCGTERGARRACRRDTAHDETGAKTPSRDQSVSMYATMSAI